MSSTDAALAAIEQIAAETGDADDLLRRVVSTLHDDAGYGWAAIFFVESGDLVLGPWAGEPDPERRTTVPVTWQSARIADLCVDGARPEDRTFLERAAALVAGLCLVGWDTGGEAWEP